MYRFIVFAVVVLLCLPLNVRAKSLTIVTLDSAPLEFIENDKPKGVLVDVVSEAVKRAGYSCEIKIVPWKRALSMVRKGYADAVFNAAYNAERSRYLVYPDEVLITEKIVAWRRIGSGVNLASDLEGASDLTVGVGRGFYYGQSIQRALDEGAFKRVEEVPNIDLNINKLLLGRLDLFFGDYYPVLDYLNQNNLLTEVEAVVDPDTDMPAVYSESKTYLAFSRKVPHEIFEKVSAELKKMKEDGSYRKIITKHLPMHNGF